MASSIAATRTVVVADDHPLFRAALIRLVGDEASLTLTAVAIDGGEALKAILEHQPDVAVLDMRMPVLSGSEVSARLVQSDCATRVLLLSEYHDGEIVTEALEAGAAGYLSKSATAAQIIQAIVRVAEGESVLDSTLGDRVAEAIRARGGARPHLSPRERDVLRHIADGHGSREIAMDMHLAVPTIKTHLAHLYQKLGVNDRASAVAEAMRQGLLE
jgi:two-component system, NarL family, nitrate/nitrite response regulator NarL